MSFSRICTGARVAGIGLAMALAVGTSAKRESLGTLGQAIKPLKIYRAMSERARTYSSAQQFEYLVVRDSGYAKWLKVMLKNRRFGYALASSITKLPYEVTAEASRAADSYTMPNVPGGDIRAAVAGYSLRFTGTPYKWGGNDLLNGVDCSGFVKELFAKGKVGLPRTAAQQALVGTPITRMQDLQAGDRLYFWDKRKGKIGHTGIYLGNGYFIHSSPSNRGVATDPIMAPKWRRILVAARR